MTISFASLAGGKYQRTEIITSTREWVCPAGVTAIEVFLVGGGGGGATSVSAYDGYNGVYRYSDGPGGGGGGVTKNDIAVTPGNSYTVTIGAGGSTGSAGSDSSFGTLLTSYGGFNGNASNGQKKAGGGGTNRIFNNSQWTGQTGGGGAGVPVFAYNGYTNAIDSQWSGVQGYPAGTYSFPTAGNPGINGYGAGGGAGTTGSTVYYGGLNAGDGASSGTNATDAAANFGGGGGGGTNSPSKSGSSGGSGVCIIKYWA